MSWVLILILAGDKGSYPVYGIPSREQCEAAGKAVQSRDINGWKVGAAYVCVPSIKAVAPGVER